MKKLPRWRREQRQRKIKHKLSLFRFFLVVVVLIFIALILEWGWKTKEKSLWDGKSRFNFVFATKPILVVSLNPTEETLSFILIPSETYLEVPSGYGFYRAGAVYELGELEKGGGELLSFSLQEFLGVPIEGWVAAKKGIWEVDGEDLLKFKNKITSWEIFLTPSETFNFLGRDLKTNLTFYDLGRIWWKVKNVRFDKIEILNLGKGGVLSDLILADGSLVKTIDSSLLDGLTSSLFFEEKIRSENLKLEVLNSTPKLGLANRVARLITNLGGGVINIGNIEEEEKRCQIEAEKRIWKTHTLSKLKKIFNCQLREKKQEGSRADIILIIGEDYWKKLSTK